MIIKLIPYRDEDTAVHELPEPDMIIDPRPIGDYFTFEVAVNGTALTLTRIDRKENERPAWNNMVALPPFRVYSRNEFHYSFESTKYLYHGIEYETAPADVTEIVVKDGVETIRTHAFSRCGSLSKITMPATVTNIGRSAFSNCTSLRCIQLPLNLQYIGESAFRNCSSLEAIYIPPTVTKIDAYAFEGCESLRIINTPDGIRYVIYDNLRGCYNLIDETYSFTTDEEDEHQWLRSRYNPLHNLCWDPSVTANKIQQYIQQHHDGEERATTNDKPQFTALHLIAANPSVTGDMITAYLQLAPDVATMQDNKDKTSVHMLCSAPYFVEGIGSAIEAYLGGCMEGKKAAFMTDHEERTPFDYLCKKSFDELLFLENKSFAGLMVWWYNHCLDISLFAEDIDEEENF